MTMRTLPETREEQAQLQHELEQELRQVEGMNFEDGEKDLVIEDATPGRKLWHFYSMLTGEEVWLPKFLVKAALRARLPDGSPMFTAYKSMAPVPQPGTWKCFLHPEAPEREVLRKLGIYRSCPFDHGPNEFAKREHQSAKHPSELQAYNDYIYREQEKEFRQQRSEEIAAIRDLATAAAAAAVTNAQSAVATPPAGGARGKSKGDEDGGSTQS